MKAVSVSDLDDEVDISPRSGQSPVSGPPGPAGPPGPPGKITQHSLSQYNTVNMCVPSEETMMVMMMMSWTPQVAPDPGGCQATQLPPAEM